MITLKNPVIITPLSPSFEGTLATSIVANFYISLFFKRDTILYRMLAQMLFADFPAKKKFFFIIRVFF
jgi:hypothetical protein